jgi:hypothetical protein
MGTVSWPDPEVEAIRSREDLAEFLVRLSTKVREGTFPMENTASPDLVNAAGRWVRAMDGFFMNRGEEVPEVPDWAMIAAVFCAALMYE